MFIASAANEPSAKKINRITRSILHQQGLIARCVALLQQVIDITETGPREWVGSVHDARASAYNWLAICATSIGRIDEARRLARMAVDIAEEIAQPFVLSQSLSLAAPPLISAGEYDEARCAGAASKCAKVSVCHTGKAGRWSMTASRSNGAHAP